jgi:hypothetical protein
LSIFQDVRTPLPHIETCWFASLRTFLGCIGSTLEVDNDIVLPIQREHNTYIMDWVLTSDSFNPNKSLQIIITVKCK